MKKVYVAIGNKTMNPIILGAFRSKEDAENFANDFDKAHCDVSEDDLYYSDEDFDNAMDWCQDAWHPERWDDTHNIPRIAPDDFELSKLISDVKNNDIMLQSWEPTTIRELNIIDVYEGPEKVEEIYRENCIKIDDLF
jgi:hypothetical protein